MKKFTIKAKRIKLAEMILDDIIRNLPTPIFWMGDIQNHLSKKTSEVIKQLPELSSEEAIWWLRTGSKEIQQINTPSDVMKTLKGGSKQRIYYTFTDPSVIIKWKLNNAAKNNNPK
jgi:hypothetical protein